jgi:hypothetical protein
MNLVVWLPAMFVLGLAGIELCPAFVSACGEQRAGCHRDWRGACTSRDVHPVLLQTAVPEPDLSPRLFDEFEARSMLFQQGVLIDIATFVGLTVLYFAYDAYVSRRRLPGARTTVAHEYRTPGTVRPFVARPIQKTQKPKIMLSTRNTTRRRGHRPR